MEKLSVKNPKQANKRKNKKPVKIVYISNPMKVKASAEEFRSVVQELTGKDSDVENLFSPALAEAPNPLGAASQAESNSWSVQPQPKPGHATTDSGRFDSCSDDADELLGQLCRGI